MLGAGLSRRYGRQKMLERWQGQPLLRRTAALFVEAGLQPVIVVVSPDPALREALERLPLTIIENDDPAAGIGRSIGLGVTALPDGVGAACIGVADQPYLTPAALSTLIAADREAMLVVPRYGDHRGNPSIFDRRFFEELQRLTGDVGGQRVIAAHPDQVIEVALPATMGVDIDRPEDWER